MCLWNLISGHVVWEKIVLWIRRVDDAVGLEDKNIYRGGAYVVCFKRSDFVGGTVYSIWKGVEQNRLL